MSSVLDRPRVGGFASKRWMTWLPVAIGLAILYIPTYVTLASGIWSSEEQGHGPIVLAVVAWLFWQRRDALIGPSEPNVVGGYSLLLLGLLLYIVGRSQDILMFEVGSHIPVIAGALLLMLGNRALRTFWFPLLFIIFMIPLPGFVVDGITGPLKQSVSRIAEQLLYVAGYPIGRTGVTLTVGPYQLLVADACSGLHSMFSLSALGLLYLYLMKHTSFMRNGIIMASILPIAFAANILRVIILVLITYHLGDAAGQGFLHGFAGMILFAAALGLLFGLDGALGLIWGDRTRSKA